MGCSFRYIHVQVAAKWHQECSVSKMSRRNTAEETGKHSSELSWIKWDAGPALLQTRALNQKVWKSSLSPLTTASTTTGWCMVSENTERVGEFQLNPTPAMHVTANSVVIRGRPGTQDCQMWARARAHATSGPKERNTRTHKLSNPPAITKSWSCDFRKKVYISATSKTEWFSNFKFLF